MPLRPAFSPYRPPPGALPEEAARLALAQGAGPLLVPPADPLPAALVASAYAELPAGRAATEAEACRAADGSPSGVGGPPRACLTSERHRARVEEAVRGALLAGFGGVALDRPDASLAQGLLGAGFCADCQREFARRLTREYGDQFQPVDYLAMAREAVAQAPGALDYRALPFGREFWRFRHEALERAVRAAARAARDAARQAGRPLAVAAWFEAAGPAQLAAARHLDAAVFPARLDGDDDAGLLPLLRAVMGRRPVAVAAPPGASAAALARLAVAGAPFAVGLAGLEPQGEAAAQLARVRAFAAELGAQGRMPGVARPTVECAVLYSAEADLWTAGHHRRAVELAAAALWRHHVQAHVVLRLSDAPPGAVLVLAGAGGLTPHEAREAERRLERGAGVLCLGTPLAADEAGRAPAPFLPEGKPGGLRAGGGTLAELPPPVPESGPEAPVQDEPLDRALSALLGKGRRAVGVAGRARLLAVLWRTGDQVDVHLATPGGERSQGNTLFLGLEVAGSARRARFRSADGADVQIRLNPSGYSVSTVLPSFSGYGVLRLEA